LADSATQELLRRTSLLFREAEETTSHSRLPLLFDRWCLELLRSIQGNLQADMLADDAKASLSHVKRAEAWMDAHLAQEVRMEDLAAHSGVGVRALQKAFKRWRGFGPLQALKQRRLEHARSVLLQEPDTTVQDAARRSGIGHPGRFSAEYRQRFSESPSETKRRARPTPFYISG
jgi:transcriptional regulator GlxA family with amidase domain